MKMNDINESIRAEKIAGMVGGELKAPADLEISEICGAASAGENSLTYAEDEGFLQQALQNGAALILLEEELYTPDIEAIVVDKPRLAYARAAELFPDERYRREGVADEAYISSAAELAGDVAVHAGVTVEGSVRIGSRTRIAPGCTLTGPLQIGQDCLLHPDVTVLPGCEIGDRVEIQSGAVIGSDGFGYASQEGSHYRIPQQGRVIIEDDVEIGALTAVDRAADGETRIGAGSKIDNLVQISHNVQVGPAALIAGQSGIAGSTELGERVTLAGQVGIIDHLQLGDDITFTGKAKVGKNIEEAGIYSGIPARPHREYLKLEARMRRLPRLKSRIDELEDKLEKLKEEMSDEDGE